MNLNDRIAQIHRLNHLPERQIISLLNTIVEQKNLECLKLFVNKPGDYKWGALLGQPKILQQFWLEQWYEGWGVIAPYAAQTTNQMDCILRSISSNKRLSDGFVECVLKNAAPGNGQFANHINELVTHSIKTNDPTLFDRCVQMLTVTSCGLDVVRNFRWVEHITLACDIHRVWAMDKIIRATQDDNVFYQVLSDSSLQIEELKQLYNTVVELYPNNSHLTEKVIGKLTVSKDAVTSYETWNFLMQIMNAPNTFHLTAHQIGKVFSVGLRSEGHVPLDELKSFCTKHVNTAGDILMRKIFDECNKVGEELFKYLCETSNCVYKTHFAQMTQSHRAHPTVLEYWLHKIDTDTDAIIAQSSVSSATLDAWKITCALQDNISAPPIQGVKKKM